MTYGVKIPRNPLNCSEKDLFQGDAVFLTPNVDAFNFSHVSRQDNSVFIELEDLGFTSKLISEFANKQKRNEDLLLPFSNRAMLKTVPLTKQKDGKTRKEGTIYIVPDGYELFILIYQYDPGFFVQILKAIKKYPKKFCISRVDLCFDCSMNLMNTILDSMKQRLYKSFGRTPYIFVRDKDGIEREGPIPRTPLKDLPPILQDAKFLHSLYSGNLKTSNSTLLIYDKTQQYGVGWPYPTRFEMKVYFNSKRKLVLSVDDVLNLMISYSESKDSAGVRFRSQIFLFLMFKSFHFLLKRNRPQLAPWFLVMAFRPLMYLIAEKNPQPWKKKRGRPRKDSIGKLESSG